MADGEMVSGDGWISDDSSLYGTEEEQQRQSRLPGSFDLKQFWRSHSNDINVVMIATRTQLPTDADAAVKSPTSNDDALPRKKQDGERSAEQSPRLELFNPLQGQLDAWQLGESVDEFVRRLPPLTTSIFTCPWIWAVNPHRNPRDKSPCPRVDEFTTCGLKLLQQSLDNRRKIQESGAARPKGSLTKQLSQESKSLQDRIASLAKDTRVLSGKWMLFPKSVDVTRVWKQIVSGVIENRLGCSCKVATDDGKEERLVCAYTKDFQDTEDVRRVLQELENMGLLSAGRTIYYKSDAYTYLDLRRENAAEYGLQASLYNSRSMLAASKATKSASLNQKKQSTLST